MPGPIHLVCALATYAVALAIEVAGLWWRAPIRRIFLIAAGLLALVAHTWYLWQRAQETADSPLASPADWCLLLAWLLGVIYLTQVAIYRRMSLGLFMLPLVLALMLASEFAPREPFATEKASRFWSAAHGTSLLFGTATVSLGFLSGIMYLVQSYRLKRKLPPSRGLRLPSLEWLEKVNSGALGVSAVFIGVGFTTGVLLNLLAHRNEVGYVPWSDPVVISLGAMLLWLVAAEFFRLAYPAARSGRKVAYLTLAAFGFLCFTLFTVLAIQSHQTASEARKTDPPAGFSAEAPQ